MDVKKIGFDFDKVFVSYPPIVPDKLIDFLYKGRVALMSRKKANEIKLEYRIPNYIEKQIRVLSHSYIFRPPLKNNIRALKRIRKSSSHEMYLISSRFGFLRDKTNAWIDKNKMKNDFKEIHFNFKNSQPHIFKENIIKKKGIEHYIDDDLDLLVYLSKKIPYNHYYWLSKTKKHEYKSLPKNIKIIKSISDLKKYI